MSRRRLPPGSMGPRQTADCSVGKSNPSSQSQRSRRKGLLSQMPRLPSTVEKKAAADTIEIRAGVDQFAERPMADNKSDEKKDDESGHRIERWVGIAVVVLATFLGVCNVKDANIVQAMQKALVEKNDNWAWYQARNIRNDVYRSAADQLSVPYPGETPAIAK